MGHWEQIFQVSRNHGYLATMYRHQSLNLSLNLLVWFHFLYDNHLNHAQRFSLTYFILITTQYTRLQQGAHVQRQISQTCKRPNLHRIVKSYLLFSGSILLNSNCLNHSLLLVCHKVIPVACLYGYTH